MPGGSLGESVAGSMEHRILVCVCVSGSRGKYMHIRLHIASIINSRL